MFLQLGSTVPVGEYSEMWGLNQQSKNLCTEVRRPATMYSGNVHTPTPVYTIYAKLAATMLSKPYPSIDPSTCLLTLGRFMLGAL